MYVPVGGINPMRRQKQSITMDVIANERFVMVPDSCGLSRCTHNLFKRNNYKLKNYQGNALSYNVLQDWAKMGVGAAIIPKSKLTEKSVGIPIEENGGFAQIEFHAMWSTQKPANSLIKNFRDYMSSSARKVLRGLA